MLRRSLLALVFAPRAHSRTQDDFQRLAVEFERYWSPFVRELFGCSLDETVPMTQETCERGRAVVNYAAYTRARKAAKEMFDFTD